eukprot:SAG31_NODE_8996_length_1350_cov_1.617906_1_plen_50_part_00
MSATEEMLSQRLSELEAENRSLRRRAVVAETEVEQLRLAQQVKLRIRGS